MLQWACTRGSTFRQVMWLAFGAVWDLGALGWISLETEEALNLVCDFCAKVRGGLPHPPKHAGNRGDCGGRAWGLRGKGRQRDVPLWRVACYGEWLCWASQGQASDESLERVQADATRAWGLGSSGARGLGPSPCVGGPRHPRR
jgi:hypothetical protein